MREKSPHKIGKDQSGVDLPIRLFSEVNTRYSLGNYEEIPYYNSTCYLFQLIGMRIDISLHLYH
jgi:hypothetical protein